MAATGQNESSKSLFLDPEEDKEKYKERIAETIDRQVEEAEREEVDKAVEQKYEALLKGARVKQHVPTLTEGDVKAEFQKKAKR